jgi:serine protease Do
MTLYRNGKLMTLSVDIGLMPGSEQQAAVQEDEPAAAASVAALGLTLSPTGSDGVLVDEITAGGVADTSGLQQGDVILEIGGERVSTPAEVESRLASMRDNGKKALLLLVRTGDRQRFVALQLDQG